MTIALRPWPTSICKNPGVSAKAAQCPPPLRSCVSGFVHPKFFHVSYGVRNVHLSYGNIFMPPLPDCLSSSYLAGGDKLQRPEGSAHVWNVGLELVQSSSNVGLDLIWLGPRWAVGRNLVEGLSRHGGRCLWRVVGCRGGGGVQFDNAQRQSREDTCKFSKRIDIRSAAWQSLCSSFGPFRSLNQPTLN